MNSTQPERTSTAPAPSARHRLLSVRGATAVAGTALLLALGATATAQALPMGPFGGGPSAVVASLTPSTTTTTVDAGVAAALQFSREEERVARDLYAALAATYDGAAPFSMITRSEQVHYDAVGTLLTRYGVSDPSAGRSAGTYADPVLQTLYDSLLTQGNGSLDAAYDVGVAVEKRDIADLDATLAGSLPADVRAVLTNLRTGSEHHLTAFENAANGVLTGGGYGPMGTGGQAGSGYGTAGTRTGNGTMGNGMGARGTAAGTGDCLLTDSGV